MIRLQNFNVTFDDKASLENLAAKRLELPPQFIAGVVVVRKAVDARRYKGAPIRFVYILDVELTDEKMEKKVLNRFRKDKSIYQVERFIFGFEESYGYLVLCFIYLSVRAKSLHI